MRTLALVGLIALTMACSSTPAQPAPGGAAAPSTSAPTAATAAPTAASGPNIADLLKAGKLTSYKVTYTWSVTSGGQTQSSQQTWYYKAPNARFDVSLGQGTTFSVYALPDGTYFCSVGGGATFCQKSAQGGLQQNPAADFDLQLSGQPDQFNAAAQGTRTIAGQQAQCYGVRALTGAALGDVTACYSASGVPLFLQSSGQGSSFTMEATAFSATVSDADFVLPAAAR